MRFQKIKRKMAAVLIMSLMATQVVSASPLMEDSVNGGGDSDSGSGTHGDGNTAGNENSGQNNGNDSEGSGNENAGENEGEASGSGNENAGENEGEASGSGNENAGENTGEASGSGNENAGENEGEASGSGNESAGENTGGAGGSGNANTGEDAGAGSGNESADGGSENTGSGNESAGDDEHEGSGSDNTDENESGNSGSENTDENESEGSKGSESGTDEIKGAEASKEDHGGGAGGGGNQGKPDASKEDETEEPSAPDTSEEAEKEEIPQKTDRAEEDEEEAALSGRIVFMCDEGDINTDKVKFAVFKDGVLTMSAKVKYEKDTEDSDYSDFTVWNYEVSGLPDLEEGEEEPVYGLKDVNYSLNSDREGLFYISDDGSAEPMGAKPCEAVNADFIYVSRSEISGLYEVESESSEIPEDGSVKMAISAADEADCRYLDRPDKAELSQKTGKWSASELLAYNPETGQPIDWRVEIIENDDDFEAVYSNVEFFEGDESYAYNGGTILNTFTGESTFGAVGRIQWKDYGDLYGKRPDHLSFIHVFTEDGEDVTDDVTVRATPSEAGYHAADEEWSYEVSGLTKGTSYRVGQELKNYKSEPQFAHITEPAGQGTAGSIELITESTIDRSIKGLIRWKDSKKYGKRPDDLSFLKVLADGEDVTKNVRITLTEAHEKDGDTWEYMVSGMNEGVNYIIQAEEPEGYLANITEVSVISTAKNRLAKDLEASGTLGDEDGGRYISQTGAITLTATKEVSGTVTWNDNDDYWKIRPDKEEMGLLLGIQNSDIQIDVKEDGNVWKYSIKNLPFNMEIRTAVPDGYQSARKWSLFRTGDNGTNLIFKALTHKLTITNTSRGTEGSSESYEFQYKVLTGDGGNETLYNGEYVTGGKRKTAIDGIVQIPANGAAELELPDGTGCKIEQTNQADTFICFDSRVQSITVSSDQTAEFVNTLMTTYIAVKNWNDNNSKSRPADEFKTKVKLYYAVGSGGSREIKDDNLAELGLETVPAAAFKDEDTNMPRLYYTNMPSTTREGTKITYSIQEVPMDGYICTPYSITDENGGKIDGIMNTLESSFHGTKSWKDSGNRYHTRISREKWLELIVLRYTTEAVGGGSFDQSAGTMLNIQTADPDGTAYWNWISDESTDDWTFTIDNLPQFDEKGQEYTYWLEEKDVPLDGSPVYSAGISDVHYEQEYENKGNYTNLLTACFDEGIMLNKLVGTTTYEATKIWLDELTGADREKRPDAILYLYRYPNTDGKNYKTATELKDTRFKDDTEGWLREDNDEKTIHIEISELNIGNEKEKLAAFDEDGTEFIYFIRESMQASGYEQILENVLKPAPDGADSRLFNGGTLKNRRKGNASVGVSKKWTADALQGMDASVTFTLEQRLKNLPASEDNPWEPAGEETLSGFTAEMMTKSLAFSTSRFDEYGREYEFRIAESEIRIDGRTAQSVTDEDGNTIFYAEPIDDHGVRKEDYYYFEMTETGTEQTDGNKIVKLDEGGIGAVDVDNRLTGKTKIGVKKRWKGGKPAKDYELSFHIMRDGSDICGELDETLKNNPDHKGVFKFTSEKEKLVQDKDDVDTWWTGLVDYKNSLSKYDENGKEYNYKVKEDPVDGYAYAEYTYEKDHGHKAAVVTNYPPGEGKSIWVTKVWQDESDTIHRFPVKAQLYKSRDNKPVDGKTVILREENDWTGWIGVDEGELDDYYILESAVSRSNDEKEWADVKYNGGFKLDASDGDVETSKHYYKVENKKISKSEYEITNTRYGFVDVSLTKNWIDGDSEPVAAEFKLTRKSPAGEADHTESYTLDGKPDTEYQNGNGKETKAWKLEIAGLDKYDEKGRLYSYSMAEVKVGDQDATGGAFTLYGEPYVCSVSGGTYELGVDGDNVTHHKRDKIAFEAVNQKSDTVLSPMIHKIWKDDGPLESSRPDIYLELWKEYKISGRTEPKQEQVDVVNYHWDKVKDDAAETNHWIGIFESSLPLYTNEGYPITYYVKEGVHVSSDYKLYYGADAPKNNDWEMDSGLGEVPGLDGDSGNSEYELSQGAPLGGTIINIPSAERTVSGKKIWQNMGVLHSEDYPEIELKLYRLKAGYVLEDSGNDSSAWEEAKDTDANLVESFHLRSGLTSFEFTGLPKYDTNTGKMIIYAVREENTPMGFEAMDPEYNHDFHLVNTYHESTDYAIQLNKVWDVAAAELAAAGEYPEADVYLERVMKAPDGADTLEYTRNTAYKKGVITKLSSTPDTYGCRFTDLPKYAPNGLEYQYEVREVQINGYNEVTKLPVGAFEGEAKEAAAELTNTYDGDTSDNQFANIIVTKKWNDSSSFYGTRHASDKLHFQVYRKAEGYIYTAPDDPDKGINITGWLTQSTVSADSGSDSWVYTFAPDSGKSGHEGELRRYAANGKPYVYTIVESKVDGYNDSKEISVSKEAPTAGTELAAELTNKLDTVSLDVQKKWDDDENVYLTRPDEIKVQIERSIDRHQNWTLYKIKDEAADENGIVTITKTNSAGTDQNNWERKFSGLPKYDYSSGSQVLVEYRVREVFESGSSIVNYAGPEYKETTEASTDGISYRIEITNTLLSQSGEVTSFSAEKAWEDNDNLDGLRPESVTFILVRDGKELSGKTAVIDGTADPGAAAGDGREYEPWTVQWDDLPKLKADGSGESRYSVKEAAVSGGTDDKPLPGYTTAYGLNGNGVYIVTNRHAEIANISLTAEKKWNDSDDAWKLRPLEIKASLYQWYAGISGNEPIPYVKDGSVYEIALNAGNDWKGTFTDLPYMHREGDSGKGSIIYYSVKEAALDGEGKNLLGSYSLSSSWTGGNTPEGSDSGKGFSPSDHLAENPAMTVTMTNSIQEVSCRAEKVWADNKDAYGTRPDEVTVGLYRRQKGGTGDAEWKPVLKSDGGAETAVFLKLTDGTDWKGEFKGLPEKDRDGTEFEYKVFELDSSGNALEENTELGNYTVTYQLSTDEFGFKTVITNTAKAAGSVSVEKVWKDGGNQDGIRPATLTVHLQASTDGASYSDFDKRSAVDLNEANGWKYQWDALPERNTDGKEYSYRIVEEWPADQTADPWSALYTAGDGHKDGITVVPADLSNASSASDEEKAAASASFTNSYTPRTLSVTVSKTWDGDSEVKDITRPDTLTFTLYRQAEGKQAEKYVPLSGSSNTNPVILNKPSDGSEVWTDTAAWSDLPVSMWDSERERSRKITYWVVEMPIQGYEVSQSALPEKLFGCTAAADGDLCKVTGKTGLLENGTSAPEKQTAEVTVTNTLNAVEKKVVKLWDHDSVWGDDSRPDEIQVQLYKSYTEDGSVRKEAVGAPVTLSGSDLAAAWTYTWKNLPRYQWSENIGDDGEKTEVPIVYTAEEAAGGVPGYTQSMKVSSETSGTEEIEVFQITNTMNTASVDIEKSWDDSDNYYHTRPETITVRLQRSVDEGDQKNWTDVVRPAGVTDGIQLGGGIWGRKLTKEKIGAEYGGRVWKWTDVFTGLPTHDKNGNAYSYRAAEVDDEANGYVWSDEAVSESAAGTGKKFTQMLTNALDTAQVSGTKIWIDKSSFFHTRPDSIALTLTGSTKSRIEWIQVPAGGQPVWTKQGDTWKYEYKGLPKYLILTENGAVQKEEITWTVKETVPAGYTLIQDGYDLTNTLDTLGDWTVMKTWNDENDKYHVRPSSISFSVWADGVKLNPQPAAHRDGWTYTLKGLPAVYPAGHPKEGQPVDYEVREDGTDFYTTVTATSSEATYFTNTLIQGGLSVSKQRVKGADEEFRFRVTLTGPDGSVAAMQPQIYTGGYKVFQGLGADVAVAPSAQRMTAADGIITIRADEKFLLTGLPAGFTYQVEEIGAEGYEVTADHSTGIIVKDGISEASFTNTASGKLKITNVTENPGSAVSGEGSSTAGGRVTVITESSSNPDKPDTDPYQPDKTAISWKPEQYWMTGGSLVIRYTDYGTELEKTVTVKDYCDESGRMKPLSDPCYKELLERFPEADIAQASDGTITMALAGKAENMPKQTAVEVTFIPTIKGHLLTGTETGSVNEQGVSGSIGEGGDIRYNGSRVMGTAASAYTAEVEKLLVGGPGLSKPVTITVLKDGTFTEEIEVDIYGVPTKVTVSGKAVYTYSGSRITNVEIVMDEVPVPLDLGIGFKRKSSGSSGGGGGGGSSTTPGTKPGAGDTNSAGPGVETEQGTNPADPLSPTGPVNPTDPLNPADPLAPADPSNPDTVQPAGPAVIEPDKPGRPPVQMEKNPEGGIDITVPGDDVSEVEVKDEGDHEVYRGPVENGSVHLELESGIYTLTTIDENGVPLASFPFQIDDGGVPLGLPKTGDTGNLPYALLTAIMAGALIGAMALRRKKETEEE